MRLPRFWSRAIAAVLLEAAAEDKKHWTGVTRGKTQPEYWGNIVLKVVCGWNGNAGDGGIAILGVMKVFLEGTPGNPSYVALLWGVTAHVPCSAACPSLAVGPGCQDRTWAGGPSSQCVSELLLDGIKSTAVWRDSCWKSPFDLQSVR